MVKHPPANAGDVRDGFNPWVWEIPGEGHGNLLLAWRIPWTEEPSRLQSIRVGEDWNALAGKCALYSLLARPSIWCWNFHLLPFSVHLKYILKNLILIRTYFDELSQCWFVWKKNVYFTFLKFTFFKFLKTYFYRFENRSCHSLFLSTLKTLFSCLLTPTEVL